MIGHYIIEICQNHPEIVIFLSLAIGYFIGKIKFFGFSVGSTVGVLIAALLLGQLNIDIPPLLKTISFALFIFVIGYKVGPEFFGGLKKGGLSYLWISLIVAVSGLIAAIILGKIFSFDKGSTAGLLAGAMTQSTVIGTAEGAIKCLSLTDNVKNTLVGNVAIAYGITYIFGTAGLVIFFKIIPRVMKIDLKEESRKLEEEMSGGVSLEERPELFSWYRQLDLRVYQVTNQNAAGKTVREIETLFPGRVAADRMKRGSQIIDPAPDTVIQIGDIVAMVGFRRNLLKGEEIIGSETDDRSVTDLTGEIMNICVLKPEAVGKTLGELSKDHGHGCFLRRITRQGHEIPITRDTIIHKCDVLQVAGAQKDVEKAIQDLGYPERPTGVTDMVVVGIGIILGTLLGLLSVPVAGVPITLGVGGGVLVSGLFFGWLRSVHPTFGQVPNAAQWLFSDLGLNLFIACVGLAAAPEALKSLETTGMSLFFAGIILTLTPATLGMLFGMYILKMNPVLLFGAIAGAETNNASINAIREVADSSMPVLGFTLPYAFGNVILTIWGTVIVHVM